MRDYVSTYLRVSIDTDDRDPDPMAGGRAGGRADGRFMAHETRADKERAAAIATACARWRERIVETSEGCWPWPGSTNFDGVGLAQIQLRGRMAGFRAHRMFWEAERGPLTPGEILRWTTCATVGCVRPDHHEAMPRADLGRMIDSPPGLNAQRTHCVRGHPLAGPESDVYKRRTGGRQCRICDRLRYRGEI
jgi:hypothetical protein